MKMGFLFSGIFWGAVLIVIGLCVIINIVFGIRIPIFRILLALFFLYLGISLLIGTSVRGRSKTSVVFEETRVEGVKASETYGFVFSKGDVDLTRVTADSGISKQEVNAVFSSAQVRTNPAVPTKVVADGAFASIRLPDGSITSFGHNVWRSDSLDESKGYVLVKVSAVFSGVEVTR